MTIPNQTLTIKDPGLGLVEPATNQPILVGCSSAGTVNKLVSVQSPIDAVTAFGQGPLVEDACTVLGIAGGPILMGRANGSVAGVAGSVTQSGGGPVVSVAGAPYDAYLAKIVVTLGGALGAGKFKYTLENHGMIGPDGKALDPTYSAELTIPSGGTYAIPNTNLTLTFAAGTYVLDETYTFTCTAPYFAAADLDAFFDVVRLLPNRWRLVHLAGQAASASAAATLAAGLATEMSTQQTLFRYARGFMDCGADTDANVLSSFTAFEDRRVSPCSGMVARISGKPFAGWSVPKLPAVAEITGRAVREQISTHLGRVASGALTGVRAISHDEFTAATPLDVARISTLRTWPNRPGFYITRGRLASPLGSDFKYTHNGFVMDVACTTVVAALQEWANKSFRTTSTGTIDPRDAADVEQSVRAQLRAQLTEPINAEGKRGHVSDLNFTVDLTNNLNLTGQVNTEVAIRPLGYGEYFTTQIGFALDVGN